jgi:hypothetical protein
MVRTRRLQVRDVDMLAALSIGRYLTAEALEWLHFPQWRGRYRAYLERARTDKGARYVLDSHVYKRLDWLRREGLVGSIGRSVDLSRHSFARLQGAYHLTEGGAEVVSALREVPKEALWWEGGRKRSWQNVEHSVAIGMLYAALRCALEHHGKQLVGWKGDHLHRDPRSYDRIRVPGQREPLPVQPDATFVLDNRRYFVEIDRGTRPLPTWGDKALAYHTYRGSKELRARYGVSDFTLLTVAPTAGRVQRIAEQLVNVTRAADGRYLLLEAQDVHPVTIRSNWLVPSRVSVTTQRVVNRLAEVYQPSLTAARLWEAP